MTTATQGYAVRVLSSVFIIAQSNTRNRESLISCLLKLSHELLILGQSTFSESLVFTEFYFLEIISLFYKWLLPFFNFCELQRSFQRDFFTTFAHISILCLRN